MPRSFLQLWATARWRVHANIDAHDDCLCRPCIRSCMTDCCQSVLCSSPEYPLLVQGGDNQKYEEVTDQGRLLKSIKDYLADYNMQSKTRMDLVLFQYAAEHVCRIMRIIKQPFGNALLVRTFHRLSACADRSWPSVAAGLWPPHTAPSSPVRWPITSMFISCTD